MKLLRNLIISPADFLAEFRNLRREGFRIVEGKSVLLFTLGLLIVNFGLGFLLEPASPLAVSTWFFWVYLLGWWFAVALDLLLKGEGEEQGYLFIALGALVAYLGIVHSLVLWLVELIDFYTAPVIYAINVLLVCYFVYLIYSLLAGIKSRNNNLLSGGRILCFVICWLPGVVLLLPFNNIVRWIAVDVGLLAVCSLFVAYYGHRKKMFESSWKLSFFSLLAGGALLGGILFSVTGGYLIVHNLRPLPEVPRLRFNKRKKRPAAQANLRRLFEFAARHEKLGNVNVRNHDNPAELLEKHNRERQLFRDLAGGKKFQVPRDWYWQAPTEPEADTAPGAGLSLVTLAHLEKIKVDREIEAGRLAGALEGAKFLLTTGGELVEAEGDLMLRSVAKAIRHYGVKVVQKLIRGEQLSQQKLREIYSLVRTARRQPEPYHDLLVGEGKTFQTYFSLPYLSRTIEMNWLSRFGYRSFYGRSLRWYQIKTRKLFRKLIGLGEKPYWKIKDKPIIREKFADLPELALLGFFRFPHGLLHGFMWSAGKGTFMVQDVYSSRAVVRTRLNCLLQEVNNRMDKPTELDRELRLNYLTGELLPANCLESWENYSTGNGACGVDTDETE